MDTKRSVQWWILLCIGRISISSGDKIPGVCTDVTTNPVNQPRKPDIPNQFTVHVQCNFLEMNMTTMITEWYDYTANKARIHQRDLNDDGDLYFDYQINELLKIDRNDYGVCKAMKLANSTSSFLFGVSTDSGGNEHIFAPSAALRFGNVPELYQGSNFKVRGITVEAWTSCQYMPQLNATMNVTWYFSAKPTWDMQLGTKSIPVRAVVVGKAFNSLGVVHDFNHIYDFFDFQPSVSPEDFQLHAGDYCPGRVNKKPFPKLPDVFGMMGEAIDSYVDTVETVEEHYDSTRKLNVYNYKDEASLTLLQNGMDKTEINDFQEGFAYIVNNLQDNCHINTVSQSSTAFVDEPAGGTMLRQQTPAQVILACNISWVYGGLKKYRGIFCDTWIGKTDNCKIFPGKPVIIEWAFAQSMIEDWNVLQDTQIPVQMTLWGGDTTDDNILLQYNAFRFGQKEPRVSNLNIAPCFHGTERVNVRFQINATDGATAVHNWQAFRTALMESLSLSLGISLLRVANIQLYATTDVTTVTFDLLDKPAIAGGVANSLTQNSLANAVTILQSADQLDTFVIYVTIDTTVVTITPVKSSWSIFFSNSTCTGNCVVNTGSSNGNDQYTGGSLAGLAVAMLLCGGAIGSGAGFYVFRYKSS